VTVFNIVCRYNNSCRALHCRLVLWSVDRPIILILFADCWARENYTLDVFVVNSRWIKGSLQHHTILQKWKWFMVVTDSLHSSIATYDLYERTARCKFVSTFQVDLEWLVHWPTAPENLDGDATTDRLDPTWKAQVDLLDPTRRSKKYWHQIRTTVMPPSEFNAIIKFRIVPEVCYSMMTVDLFSKYSLPTYVITFTSTKWNRAKVS